MIDYNLLDLNGLVTLWKASGENLGIKKVIEGHILAKSKGEPKFSKEALFNISKARNHAITLEFLPGSKSHSAFGDGLTIDLILEDAEVHQIIENIQSKPPINSYGTLRAKELVPSGLNPQQIEQLANDGFDTNDIFSIMHV